MGNITNAQANVPYITSFHMEAVNPGQNSPDIKTPDIKTPDIKTPDIKNPNIKNPNIKTPDIKSLFYQHRTLRFRAKI